MITPEKIDEWIQEAEERPWSASLLIRHIANRLNEVSQWNEELHAENIALRSEKKVDEFERQIASLEYQLELLKRQLGGEAIPDLLDPVLTPDTFNLLLYNALGQVIRLELEPGNLKSGQELAHFVTETMPDGHYPRLLPASSMEELLFVFDTGRVLTLPLVDIPLMPDPLVFDWEKAYLQLPVGSEELVQLLPIARLPLYDNCVQVSRKGCIKKIKEALFKSYLTKSYIGTGVKQPVDRMFGLSLCMSDDEFVLVSKEGFLTRLAVADLPITIGESLRLSITDHLVAAFGVGEKSSLLVVTNNGKAIHREQSWLKTAALKSKGQAAFSEARRRSGITVAGATVADEDDWGAVLLKDGRLIVLQMGDLFERGAVLPGEDGLEVIAFTVW